MRDLYRQIRFPVAYEISLLHHPAGISLFRFCIPARSPEEIHHKLYRPDPGQIAPGKIPSAVISEHLIEDPLECIFHPWTGFRCLERPFEALSALAQLLQAHLCGALSLNLHQQVTVLRDLLVRVKNTCRDSLEESDHKGIDIVFIASVIQSDRYRADFVHVIPLYNVCFIFICLKMTDIAGLPMPVSGLLLCSVQEEIVFSLVSDRGKRTMSGIDDHVIRKCHQFLFDRCDQLSSVSAREIASSY